MVVKKDILKAKTTSFWIFFVEKTIYHLAQPHILDIWSMQYSMFSLTPSGNSYDKCIDCTKGELNADNYLEQISGGNS